jgi:hypothetical protein
VTIDDAREDVGQIRVWVDVVQLAGLDQGRDGVPMLGASVGTREQRVKVAFLAALHRRRQRCATEVDISYLAARPPSPRPRPKGLNLIGDAYGRPIKRAALSHLIAPGRSGPPPCLTGACRTASEGHATNDGQARCERQAVGGGLRPKDHKRVRPVHGGGGPADVGRCRHREPADQTVN